MLAHDATGGGVMAALSGGPSLNVPGPAGQDAHIVGYTYMGISAEDVTLTCAAEDRWPQAGFSLKCNSNAAAASFCKPITWLRNRVPIRCGEALVFTGTSGANDAWCALQLDVPPHSVKRPEDREHSPAIFHTRTTAASGTNTTALTVQHNLVTLTQFGDYLQEIDSVSIAGAYTTAPFIGLKVDKPDWPYRIYLPLAETDVANLWEKIQIPQGTMPIRKGDTLEVSWLSDSTEQPTANVTLKYPVKK